MKMWKTTAAAAMAVGVLAASALAAKVTSGLEVGQGAPAFDVVDVSGPNKGSKLCYV